MKDGLKSGLAPLVLLWLAAHAVLLALILGLKFLSAKTLMLLAMVAVWFLLGRRKPQMLSAPPGMV